MIYPGAYFINNEQVTAAAQQLQWPSDPCFLVAYDSVYTDLSWITVKTIIYNNAQRIAQIVIDSKCKLPKMYTVGDHTCYRVYNKHRWINNQLYFAGFDAKCTPNGARNMTLKVFKLNHRNKLHSYLSLEIVKYLVDNNLISKKDIEDWFINFACFTSYGVYKYLNQFVKNPISSRKYIKLYRDNSWESWGRCSYIFDEIYDNPDISFTEILEFIKNFKN